MLNFIKKHSTKKNLFCFFVVKKIIIYFVIASIVGQNNIASAQALPTAPVANYAVNRAVVGIITKVALRRGFAANDPRYITTLAAASTQISALNVVATGASIALTVGGAPVWLTIAAGLGVMAVGGALIAGLARLTMNETSLHYEPAPANSPNYSVTYPSFPEDFQKPHTFLEVYSLYGAKIFKGALCYPSQPCYAFPLMPSNYQPLIQVNYDSFQYSVVAYGTDIGTGQFTVAFDSLQEFKNNFVMAPLVHSNVGRVNPSIHGVASRVRTISSYPVGNFINWTWLQDPQFDTSLNGSRIIGNYSVSNFCAGDCESQLYNHPEYFYPTTYLRDFISDSYEDKHSTFFPSSDTRVDNVQVVVSQAGVPADYLSADELNQNANAYQKAQKLSPETMAKIADEIWRRAASQPNYDGIPYSVSDPITEADVEQYYQTNAAPTLGDLLLPANEPGTNTVPLVGFPNTGTGTGTGTAGLTDVNVVNTPNVNIVGKVQLDFGSTNVTGESPLESLPSIYDAFKPITEYVNEAKIKMAWDFQTHAKECPSPTIDFFGKAITLDVHCALIDTYSDTIKLVMAFVFVFWSFMILFSA